MARRETLIIEDAVIFWRNFEGKERNFNPQGRRNFHVALPMDLAEQLKNEGWNIKFSPSREDPEVMNPHVQVEVRYDENNPKRDPEIYLIDNIMTKLDADSVAVLDNAEILKVDLEINPYDWGTSRNGVPAIKAYCKSMYVTIKPSVLASKYSKISPIAEPDDMPF